MDEIATPQPKHKEDPTLRSARRLTAAIYALQAIGFLFGLTFIAAVIANYVKRSDVQGTWLETHFRWQIRTFWFGLLWSLVGLVLVATAPPLGLLLLAANSIWVLYRIIKGAVYLSDHRELYQRAQ